MRRYPQILRNVEVADREALNGNPVVWEAVRKAEEALGPRGRVLVRASGTEPLIRVMVEASTEDEALAHVEAISGAVRTELG
jgi:phosphoglucosamine mutase